MALLPRRLARLGVPGRPGLPAGDFPENYSTAAVGPRLGYVRRGGQHGLSAFDWLWTLDFADRLFRR